MARGIDHLVVAVRDLDEAARFYDRLGFQVGARNRHAWGTENRLVQFPGSFIELIAVGEGAQIIPHTRTTFSFGAFVRDYLAHREGLAMLVLDSADASADAASFAAAGIGAFEPFFFGRRGRRPDGSETRVAFTLAFARDEKAPQAGFFVCQQHFPENFWNSAFQAHENMATAFSVVALVTPDVEAHLAFAEAFTGIAPHREAEQVSFPLARGRLDLMSLDAAGEAYGSIEVAPDQAVFAAFGVKIEDVRAQAHRLDAVHIPYQRIGRRLVIPASAAFGVAIAFEAT